MWGRRHTWWHSGYSWLLTQKLVLFRGPYGMPKVELGSVVCKAKTPHPVFYCSVPDLAAFNKIQFISKPPSVHLTIPHIPAPAPARPKKENAQIFVKGIEGGWLPMFPGLVLGLPGGGVEVLKQLHPVCFLSPWSPDRRWLVGTCLCWGAAPRPVGHCLPGTH